eukprot:4946207-Lingulodinium_polyedra.AAC.1
MLPLPKVGRQGSRSNRRSTKRSLRHCSRQHCTAPSGSSLFRFRASGLSGATFGHEEATCP